LMQSLGQGTIIYRGRRSRDRIVIGFTTASAISDYHH
jgi:hypothetical protein